MRRRVIKWSEGIWAALLGLVGFSSGCDESLGRTEYGTPHATHVISGKVTTEAETPIPGIKVEIVQKDYEHNNNILYTDKNGDYIFSDNFAWPEETYIVTFTDIDGEENGGEFEAAEKTVEIVRSDLSGGKGSWYEGKATKILDATLAEKEEVTEE